MEKPPEAAPPDMSRDMLNTIIDLEKELDKLRRRVEKREKAEEISADEVDRLRYIQEELELILSE